MKALGSVCCLVLSLSVAPVALQSTTWQRFRAYTYADQGYRQIQAGQWQEAAVAFALAYRRDPATERYLLLADYAHQRASRSAPKAGSAPSPVAQLIVRAAMPADRASAPIETAGLAIVPAYGTTTDVKRDEAGLYAGPVVRILFHEEMTPAQTAAPPTEIAMLPALAPAAARASDAELAYAALANRDYDRARSLFASAIAADPRRQWIEDSRPLAQWFSLRTGAMFRETAPAVAQSQALLGQGGSWLDASVRLNGNPEHPLALAGFLYSAQSPARMGIEARSLQAGFGLRWEPLRHVTLEATRLVKVGSASRNDWMLRGGIGAGQWQPQDRLATSWMHWQLRADTAVIGLQKRDIFAQADGRLGLGLRLTDTLSLTPYAGMTATVQKDTVTSTLVEAAPGLWLHRNGRIPLDARIEYRRKIAGTAAPSNGIAFTFGLSF